MTCQTCREIFGSLKGDEQRTRAGVLDAAKPECLCEQESVSPYSIGQVSADETLIRILVAPQHMKKGLRPKAAALTDCERSGLSVLRASHATDDEIRHVAVGLVAKARANNSKPEKAGVFGVLEIPKRSASSIQDDEGAFRAYCVYDTALEDLRSHAEIFQRVEGVTDELALKRRTDFFNAVEATFIPVQEFRNGLLSDLAPEQQ